MSLAAGLRILAVAFFVVFLATPKSFAPLFQPLTTNGAPAIYTQAGLLGLTAAHLLTVFAATAASAVVAIGLAVFVTRPAGAEFRPLSRSLVNVGQTFPPVAVLALAVPVVGFGEAPTLIALFLYGLLPIFENTLAGFGSIPPAVAEAARGMGMTDRQRLLGVELPLALPLILAGVRLSLVVNLATATIGSTVAAKGLGEVIIAGLQTNNLAFVVQGGLVVGALAVILYEALSAAERMAVGRRAATAG